MCTRFLSILLVGALASCTIDRSRDVRADTYDVYSAALDSFPATRTTSPSISSRTWRYSLSRALGETSDFYRRVQAESDVGARLLSVFDSLNTTSAELCACFPNHARVTLVADTLRADVAGPLVVSRVAFSPDLTRALVAIGIRAVHSAAVKRSISSSATAWAGAWLELYSPACHDAPAV
jgi:hypothetical protein